MISGTVESSATDTGSVSGTTRGTFNGTTYDGTTNNGTTNSGSTAVESGKG
jgi:hypothetical protein